MRLFPFQWKLLCSSLSYIYVYLQKCSGYNFAPSLQLLLGIGKTSHEPSHLHAKESQVSQLFLIIEVLQYLYHLDAFLQYVPISFVSEDPEQNTVLHVH